MLEKGRLQGGDTEKTTPTRRSREEAARLGNRTYERNVRPQVEATRHGKVIAIGVDSGDYAIANTAGIAAKGLRLLCPEAGVWLVRAG